MQVLQQGIIIFNLVVAPASTKWLSEVLICGLEYRPGLREQKLVAHMDVHRGITRIHMTL